MNIVRNLPVPVALVMILGAISMPDLNAQEERRVIDVSRITTVAGSSAGFVPSGWKIEEEISGDLNGDKRADVVLSLIEDLPADNADGAPTERFRAAIVLFKQDDGTLGRVAVGPTLLYCTTCGGMLSDFSGNGGMMRIEKGILIADQLSGSREMVNLVQRFRWDNNKKQMMLIGEDVVVTDRAEGGSETTSSNYLTGTELSEKTRYDRKKEKEVRVSKRKRKIARKVVSIEQVDYQN